MRKLLIALLLCTPVYAEIIPVNGENDPSNWQNNSGTACNAADCTVFDICDASGGTSASILFDTDESSLSGAPSTGANEQTVQGTAHEHDDSNNGSSCTHNNGGGNPSITVEIYCNGVASGVTPVSSFAINGNGVSWSGTFTFGTTIGSATCASDGSDLQFLVTSERGGGSPSGRRWLALENVEWDATVSAGGRRRIF